MTTSSQVQLAHEIGGLVDSHHGSGLSSRGPDNIAIELFAAPTRTSAS